MSILDLIFPQQCLGCKKFGDYICTTCIKTIFPLSTQICPECTRAAIDGRTHPGCQGRYVMDGLYVCYPYKGVIRDALRKLKYMKRLTDLRGVLSELTIQSFSRSSPFYRYLETKPTLVPVPLHWVRELTRGFNHAEILADTLAKELRLPFEKKFLKRTRYTKPQFGLDKKDREKNILGAFSLSASGKKQVEKNNVPSALLFDDVWTTGSTMRACARVLKKGGVKTVWGLALAR